jgi:serine/threonine-protein kinase RsbT
MDGGVGKKGSSSIREKIIRISREVDIALARHAGSALAEQGGFGNVEKHCIITSISELASNIYFYAQEGEITLRLITRADGNQGMEVIAKDRGRGIEDLEFALRDGASTHGGLGGGLPGVGRLMSEMEISSVVGQGTVVRAVKWLSVDRLKPSLLPLEDSRRPVRTDKK